MRTELVSIATDTLPLDGALHLPEGRPVTGAVLLFHGNTMNFYVGAPRFLPPMLTRLPELLSTTRTGMADGCKWAAPAYLPRLSRVCLPSPVVFRHR